MDNSEEKMKTRIGTFIYHFILLAIIIGSLASSCKQDSDENPPLIITANATNIGSTSALSGGTVRWDDESVITGRGICWGTMTNPTIEDHKIANGKGTGDFENILTGLLPNTSYYARTYVIKNGRVIYGNLVSFKTEDVVTDIDGNIYNTITIGNQVWLAENLRTTRFLNGDLIGTTTPSTLGIMYDRDPVYQWAYDGNEKNAAKYGRLYTWYAVMDPRGISPAGWHIPSVEEWIDLEKYLIANKYNYDGTTDGNRIAKSMASISGWGFSREVGAVGNSDFITYFNKIGFTALPGGYRDIEGKFQRMGSRGCWWSSTEENFYNANYRYLSYNRSDLISSSYFEFCGVSVRCVKDY
jgi:uncharacterized protein (TIGR02145 family)